LNISSDGNLGVAPSSPTPGSISLDYARLRFTSSMTLDANRGIIVPNSSVVNRGEIVVLNAGDTVIYGGKIEGYQLRHTGPGTLRLTGTESTFSGDFMLQGNAVTEIVSIGNIGAPSSIGSGNRIQIGVSMAGGTLRYLGSGDSSDRQIWVGFGTDPTHTAGSVIENEGTGALVLTGNLLTQAGTTAARLLTLGGSNTDNNTFSGLIADHDTGAGGIIGLVKSGVGKWVVAGHQTYSGATTVSGGTLQITGSIQSSAVNVDAGTLLVDGTHTGGLITVKNGAVLGGGGTVRDVQFVEGSMFLFDPALTLTVEAGYEASFLGFGVYDLVNAAGASISTWGGTLGLGPYTLMDGTVDFSSGIANVGEVNAVEIGGGKSAYFQEGSLQLVVIPEPGSLGMLGLLAAAALLRRRLRRG
jgi:fibronectin-binding autotransporter adhesin